MLIIELIKYEPLVLFIYNKNTIFKYTMLKMALKVNRQEGEEVENFTYLGSSISNKGATERDISYRLGKAASEFQRQSSIWTSNHISMKSKLSLYNSLVIPVAIYAIETWKSNNNLANKLDVFHHRCL